MGSKSIDSERKPYSFNSCSSHFIPARGCWNALPMLPSISLDRTYFDAALDDEAAECDLD